MTKRNHNVHSLVKRNALLGLAISLLAGLFPSFLVSAAPQALTFPVIGSSTYTDDYNSDRGGVKHHAIDIIASKGQKIVSATDGTIEYVTYPEQSWGYAAIVRGNDNYCYWYLHINNDVPGTDNGKGGMMHAFGPDIKSGNPIKKGQFMGWVGDSGNAESTVSHLHFGMHKLPSGGRCGTNHEDDNPPVNPYSYLKAAKKISKPVSYPALPGEVLPFKASIPVNIAVGNLDSNASDQETLVGAGYGGNPRSRSTRALRSSPTSMPICLNIRAASMLP